MSAEEVLKLRSTNDRLTKDNKKLMEMMSTMDKFRVMLISMVNNCKCGTELNIRMKFNLLMEEYYDLRDNNKTIDNQVFSSRSKKVYSFNHNNTLHDGSNHQIHHNSLDSCLNDPNDPQQLSLTQHDSLSEESNTNNEIKTNEDTPVGEVNNSLDESLDETKEIPKPSVVSPQTKDDKDLDLKERIARLRRYVARPKIYSRMNRPKIIGDQRFACSWPGCDSVFKAKVDMKTHMWRHTGEKVYACEWPGCDKRFPVKRNLARHRETHEGVKHYACDWPGCEYKSWYPQGVRAHRKRHTDERPHKCSWPHCEWTFRQSHHLKAHMLKHTGEKPFACSWPGCDNRFQSRQAMKFHFDRAHHKAVT